MGTLIGVASGYFGGVVDMVLQRLVEVVMSFPTIPLWMALAAAVPAGWSTIQTFFAVTVILALIRWVNLARQVRGMTLVQRELDYAQAARALGASQRVASSCGTWCRTR
jgi:peptide/nickel transport system permease protein